MSVAAVTMGTEKAGNEITSILRPSTKVPWSRSLAFSASALVSNVTKPKPFRERKGRGLKDEGEERKRKQEEGRKVKRFKSGLEDEMRRVYQEDKTTRKGRRQKGGGWNGPRNER